MTRMLGGWAVIVAVAMVILPWGLIGCGGADEGSDGGGQSSPTPSAQESSPAAPVGEWTTVATLRSSDPTNEMDLLVSDEFTVTGEARLVLDMPEGGETDGVIAAILPADQEISVDAALQAESVVLVGVAPEQVVGGLEGTYVLLVSVPTDMEWSIEVQTQT